MQTACRIFAKLRLMNSMGTNIEVLMVHYMYPEPKLITHYIQPGLKQANRLVIRLLMM